MCFGVRGAEKFSYEGWSWKIKLNILQSPETFISEIREELQYCNELMTSHFLCHHFLARRQLFSPDIPLETKGSLFSHRQCLSEMKAFTGPGEWSWRRQLSFQGGGHFLTFKEVLHAVPGCWITSTHRVANRNKGLEGARAVGHNPSSRVLQLQHYWYFQLGCCPVHYRRFSCILGFYPPDAMEPPSCQNWQTRMSPGTV